MFLTLHTLSKLYDILLGFVSPPPHLSICGLRRVAVTRHRTICLVLTDITSFENSSLTVCPFDCMTVMGSEVGHLNFKLTVPVRQLWSLQLTVLSRSVIVV